MGIAQDRLYFLTRDRKGAYGRVLFAYLGRKLSGYLVKDISHDFRREPMTIIEAVMRLERLMEKDEDLARKVNVMEKDLVKGRKRKYLITDAHF
jgi:chromosomal replication initiation ATPase DnaA